MIEKLTIKKKAYIISFLFFIIHIIIGGILNLTDDEAYYWTWSKHLDISYYDHPPMVAYIIKISTLLFGKTHIGVRFFAPFFVFIISIIIYKISMEIFKSEEKSLLSVIIFNIVPINYLAGFMILPDIPLLFFYSISIFIFIKIVKNDEKSLKYWYYLGITVGLGLLSKYNMFLFYFSVFLYFIFFPENRILLKKKGPYISFLISILIFLPVLIWNNNHNWASFTFHLYERHSHILSIKPHFVGQFLGSQLALLSPLIFIGLFLAVVKNIKDENVKFLSIFGLPVFLLFFSVSFISQTKVHWVAMGYIPLIIIFSNKINFNYFWKIFGAWFALILSLIITIQSFYPLLPIDPKVDITTDMYGWDLVGKEVKSIYSKLDNNWFLFSNRYQLSSQLQFYIDDNMYVYSLSNRKEQFDFWKDEKELLGKNGIFVTHSFYKVNPSELYNFNKVELLKEINIYRKNKVYRTFYIYACYNYQGIK